FTENQNKLNNLKQQIASKSQEVDQFEPGSISETRADVGIAIEEFFQQKEPVKVLALLHSAGSGKTTQLLNKILKLGGKHIIFYLTTRKIIADKVYSWMDGKINRKKRYLKELAKKITSMYGKVTIFHLTTKRIIAHSVRALVNKKIKKQKLKKRNTLLLYEKRQYASKSLVSLQGDVMEEFGKESGILQRTCEQISNNFDKCDIIFAVVTQQAILNAKNRHGKDQVHSTVDHINNYLLSKRIKNNCTFHFILDEVLGYKNGLMAIEELLSIIKKTQRGHLYILDANLYSANVLSKLLHEYNYYGVIPSSLVLCDYQEKSQFKYKGVNFYCYTRHGYPAPSIYIKRY
ncbi:MAG: hypothetical protein C0172_01460, partial [Caldisphaera sp.]